MVASEACALCGLHTGGSPVTLATLEGEKRFCCQGCARVYQVALESGLLEQVLGRGEVSPPGDWVFRSGETLHFSLQGMWCPACAVVAERLLRGQSGVLDVEVSFAAERGQMRWDPERGDPEAALRLLGRLGYQVRFAAQRPAEKMPRRFESLLLQLIAAAAFEMHLMTLYFQVLYPHYAVGDYADPLVRRVQYLCWFLATPVLFYGGSTFLRGAWRALRARTAAMDTLVALGTLSAYTYSAAVALRGGGAVYFDSVGMVTTFVVLGRFLETLGAAQARKEVSHLLDLQPETAWRRSGEDAWDEVPASDLRPDDVLLVRPGGTVPADALVLEGQASLDESLLTGESAPVPRAAGDTVFAGTLATDSALVCRVVCAVGETRLAQMAHLVEQTLAAKSPTQRLADRAAAWFTLGILAAAGATAVGWMLAGRSGPEALMAAVAVLVVACPCSLGLATPLAVAVALGRAAHMGVLLRNPSVLETAASIRRVVFDKTGTLTRGRMAVSAVEVPAESCLSPEALLSLAAAVEQFSEHPVARAVVRAHAGPLPPAGDFHAYPGAGASARVLSPSGEATVFVGKLPAGAPDLLARAEVYQEQGATVVWVGRDGDAAGLIAVRDTLNPTATGALRRLEGMGIRSAVLSGDGPGTVQAITRELELTEYAAGFSPEQKARRLAEWQRGGANVAMVGDGVNDAPALAQADLSITVAGGTAIAGESSDVVLTRPDLRLVPWLVSLSRRTRATIRRNLVWAFAYNFVAVPLAASGRVTPAIAAVAMAASSLLVVVNSLGLRRAEPK